MRLVLALALSSSTAHALSDEPPSLEYLEWNECIEIECYVSPEYPVLPSYLPIYLGTIVHRGPSPATISDLCIAAFGGSVSPGTPIHGMTIQVFTTQADSGACVDPPPPTIPDLPPTNWDDFDQTMAELDKLFAEEPTTTFGPPEGVDWP